MRISATTLESYRLWRDPEQEWMSEDDLMNTIKGVFVPNHKINIGTAFGRIMEDPDRYLVPGGFKCKAGGEWIGFDRDVMEPCLAVLGDRSGVFEAKAIHPYGECDVVSKADYLSGAELHEFKTTLSSFDPVKYMDSCQWRFMADAFQPRRIVYYVFCLHEATNGVIELKSIERLPLYPYQGLSADCAALVREFTGYVTARGLDGILRERQRSAA
jgi:hypothetical protein